MCEIETRAMQKFEAALFRRRLLSNLRHDAATAARNADRESVALMASQARNARRDGLADIAEIRRDAECSFQMRSEHSHLK